MSSPIESPGVELPIVDLNKDDSKFDVITIDGTEESVATSIVAENFINFDYYDTISEWMTGKVRVLFRLKWFVYDEIDRLNDCFNVLLIGRRCAVGPDTLPLTLCVPRNNNEPIIICPSRANAFDVDQAKFLLGSLSRPFLKSAIESRDIGAIKSGLQYAWTDPPTVAEVFGENTELEISIQLKTRHTTSRGDLVVKLQDVCKSTASIEIGVHVSDYPTRSIVLYPTSGGICRNNCWQTFVREVPQLSVPVNKLSREEPFRSEVARYVGEALQSLWPTA